MTTLKVSGMTCTNCVRHVTEAVNSVAGVTSVDVNLDAATATVEGSPDSAALIAAIVAAGYEASL
ncbi:MAG: heavy metal-associated domain-containing protein [Candidatus Nanopelagicales bacterium]|jgi:copper chaperone CopZ|nr:heavy metal-associated domain-containing protein [Candidatus Nanopelagicales bacterium]